MAPTSSINSVWPSWGRCRSGGDGHAKTRFSIRSLLTLIAFSAVNAGSSVGSDLRKSVRCSSRTQSCVGIECSWRKNGITRIGRASRSATYSTSGRRPNRLFRQRESDVGVDRGCVDRPGRRGVAHALVPYPARPRRLAMLFFCMLEDPPTIGMPSRSRTWRSMSCPSDSP